ncbi:vWA domain-containing protein [Haliangium sp.]|uniref:vWA domain-containing protein n=1 Tax=Haliangium sp. TaxID=2663208 RepID=UPI003D0CD035
MTIPADKQRSYLARQVGTLALSRVRVESPMAPVRAAAWHNAISRLGIYLPLFVIHDVGILLTTPRGPTGWSLSPRVASLARIGPPRQIVELLERYGALLGNIAGSEVVEKVSGWRMRDELVAVLLTRVLGDTYNRWRDRTKSVGVEDLPLDLGVYAGVEPAKHFRAFDPQPIWGFLEHLVAQLLHIYTSIELIDLDTVRLLGMFKEDSAHGSEALGGAVDLVDLFSALGSPEANDVANFSLELLPSVLETKRASGVQTFAVDGYASLERKGNIDSLMLTELAYDREIFEQKVLDQELLYYAHEREREEEHRLQYILVDSSASMRGQRQVFARGLALTLIKKLSLEGDEIWMRFFDSRLHELVKVNRAGQVPVPYLLSFRSERGRNYGKVFRQLFLELTRLRRDQHRRVILYIITHGQCHIAPELVSALAQQAFLYGIVILPSSEVTLEFTSLLHRYQVVDASTLDSRAGRRDRALGIVQDASESRRAEPLDAHPDRP